MLPDQPFMVLVVSVALAFFALAGCQISPPGDDPGDERNPTDAAPGLPQLSIPNASAPEGDGRLRFAVALNRASAEPVRVAYSTVRADSTVGGGTATVGVDYLPTRGILTLPAGSTEPQTFEVVVVDDEVAEPAETVIVGLSEQRGDTLTLATATGIILDDDQPGPSSGPQAPGTPSTPVDPDTPTLTSSGARTEEGTRRATFTVMLSMASGADVTVDYATGAAGDTATPWTDYTPVSGALRFPAGSTDPRTIDVAVQDDALDEADEHVTLTLSNPNNAVLATGAILAATATIVDDDEPPRMSISGARQTEGSGNLVFTVMLDQPSGRKVTAVYVTGGLSATEEIDFAALIESLTIEPGDVAATITVPIFDDMEGELEEEMFVLLLDLENAVGTTTSATGVIMDDEGLEDDHGDTKATATTATLATSIAGRLETSTDVDYFKVVLSTAGNVIAATDAGRRGIPGDHTNTVVRIETTSHTSSNEDNRDELSISAATTVYVRVSAAVATHYDFAMWLIDSDASESSFDIELVYVGTQPSAARKTIIRAAADRWERVITSGLAAAPVLSSAAKCHNLVHPSAFGDLVDDLRIYLTVRDAGSGAAAWGGPCTIREDQDGLPLLGQVILNSGRLRSVSDALLRVVVLHEIGHVLGFGTLKQWDDTLVNPATGSMTPDTHFPGSLAVAAFNDAGGTTYAGGKVPVHNAGYQSGNTHWRGSVLGTELMSHAISSSSVLSKITIQALADLGYDVDVTAADSYTLPRSMQALERLPSPSSDTPGGRDLVHMHDDALPAPSNASNAERR